LRFLLRMFQKLVKISGQFVLVTMTKDTATKETSSTGLSKALWLKVVILPSRMELEEKVFMARNSKMKEFGTHIHTKVCCLWLMLDLILMDPNSSFASDQLHT